MAAGIVEAQALEIEYMQELLAGKAPVTLPDPAADESHDH
jgi:hypothetical protein